ncbi:MAG: response regulator [Gammaproteobacteria bacterium]
MADNILLVEDEALTRRELGHTLRNQGYKVTEAADGAEALERLAQQPFDIIISDFVLPKFHGFNLLELIRSKWPKIPVIIISGYLSESGGRIILDGLADFLSKPVDPDILLARIRRFI